MMRIGAILIVVSAMLFVGTAVAAPDGPQRVTDKLPSNEVGCEEETIFHNNPGADLDQGATTKSCVLYTDDNEVCAFYTETHYWHYADYDGDGNWDVSTDEHDEQGVCVPL